MDVRFATAHLARHSSRRRKRARDASKFGAQRSCEERCTPWMQANQDMHSPAPHVTDHDASKLKANPLKET
eukprot:2941169-Rhodomonas_salina.2